MAESAAPQTPKRRPGRPLLGGERKRPVCVSIPERHLARLETLGAGSIAAGVRRVLEVGLAALGEAGDQG